MYMQFKCGGLTRDVTGSFELGVFEGDLTSIILGGSCSIVENLM